MQRSKRVALATVFALLVVSVVAVAAPASAQGGRKPFAGITLVGISWGGVWTDGTQAIFCGSLELDSGGTCRIGSSNSATMISKVIAEKDNPQVDFIFVDDAYVPELMANKALQKIDFAKIPNAGGYFGRVQKQAEEFGGYYLPVGIQEMGIGYRADILKEKNLPVPTKWADLWNPAYKGKVVIPALYDAVKPFHEGVALVWKGGYPGYIQLNEEFIWSPPDSPGMSGEELTELEVDLGDFREGLARVREKGRFGFIGKTGKYAIQPQFLSVGDFSEGLAWAETTKGIGFIRKDGTFAVSAQYEGAASFSGGLAAVRVGEKWGYIDKNGQVVIKMQFDKTGAFSEDMAGFGIANPGEKRGTGLLDSMRWDHNFPGKCGYIDSTGKVLIDAQFGEAGVFSEGLAAVRMGKLWGYIDKTGKVLIDPQFDLAEPFSEGLAAVYKGEKWGYIDKAGRMQIGLQFDKAYDFDDGLAMVWLGEKMAYILPTGKFFWGPPK